MKYVFAFLIIFLNSFASNRINAQQFCGTDESHQELYKTNTGIHQKIIDNHNWLEAFTETYIQDHAFDKKSVSYTIPVVFHVIHVGGVENISDEQIYDQLRIINEDYQGRNADTANVILQFKPLIADCQIEFKLAKLDPQGNCTKGITRQFDTSSVAGMHNVKDVIHWDPTKYLNIYVCKGAAGLAGHAIVPTAADTIPQWDGIVIVHSSVGSIGTASPTTSVVLTHEIGHYLNLQHMWGGNNVPGYPYLPVANAGNCSYDDGVNDTPNTIGWQTCNTASQSCGSLDNIQNFMEYAYCPAMFTIGQKLRMHAALNSPIAGRNNLWTATNLIETGVNNPTSFCKTDFNTPKSYICIGETIDFADLSYETVNTRNWVFEGGAPNISTDSAVSVIYNTHGSYSVKLYSGDGASNDSLIKENVITVYPPATANSIIDGFEAATSFDQSQFTSILINGTGWQINQNLGKNSSQCIYVDHNETFLGQQNELISEPLDMSGLSNVILSFDYAFAKTASNNQDNIKVKIRGNCNGSWQQKKFLSPNSLNSAGSIVTSDFFPSNNSEWKHVDITNISSSSLTNNFQIKIIFESKGGNNIFIDNVNLLDPSHVGISQNDNAFRIYPNPTNGKIFISTSNTSSVSYSIYNAIGERITTGSFLKDSLIEMEHFPAGIYIVELNGATGFIGREKIIKQ